MTNPDIKRLEKLLSDYQQNRNDYRSLDLTKSVSMLEYEWLIARDPPNSLSNFSKLSRLTKTQLIQISHDLGLKLFKTPPKKINLSNYIIGLTYLNQKEEKLHAILSQPQFLLKKNTKRSSSKNRKTKRSTPQIQLNPQELENYRKKWITHRPPSDLYEEINSLKTKKIRAICQPWKSKVKGRSKHDLALSIIAHIENLQLSTQLGKY
ncbi:MAG: hypothetical protein ACTSYI_16845 [Promethearchaeota archaeon]